MRKLRAPKLSLCDGTDNMLDRLEPSLRFVGLPVTKIQLIFGRSVNWPGAFDLSTSEWGHGSPVWWASFLPIFIFPHPSKASILNLGSVTRETNCSILRRCAGFSITVYWENDSFIILLFYYKRTTQKTKKFQTQYPKSEAWPRKTKYNQPIVRHKVNNVNGQLVRLAIKGARSLAYRWVHPGMCQLLCATQ